MTIARIFRGTSIIMLVLGESSARLFHRLALHRQVRPPIPPTNCCHCLLAYGQPFRRGCRTIGLISLPMLAGILALIVNGGRLNVMSMGRNSAGRSASMSAGYGKRNFLATLIMHLPWSSVVSSAGGADHPRYLPLAGCPDNRLLLPTAALTWGDLPSGGGKRLPAGGSLPGVHTALSPR